MTLDRHQQKIIDWAAADTRLWLSVASYRSVQVKVWRYSAKV